MTSDLRSCVGGHDLQVEGWNEKNRSMFCDGVEIALCQKLDKNDSMQTHGNARIVNALAQIEKTSFVCGILTIYIHTILCQAQHTFWII